MSPTFFVEGDKPVKIETIDKSEPKQLIRVRLRGKHSRAKYELLVLLTIFWRTNTSPILDHNVELRIRAYEPVPQIRKFYVNRRLHERSWWEKFYKNLTGHRESDVKIFVVFHRHRITHDIHKERVLQVIIYYWLTHQRENRSRLRYTGWTREAPPSRSSHAALSTRLDEQRTGIVARSIRCIFNVQVHHSRIFADVYTITR